MDAVVDVQMETDEDTTLLSGLSPSGSETERLAAAFWEQAWPKLEANNWAIVSCVVIRLDCCINNFYCVHLV